MENQSIYLAFIILTIVWFGAQSEMEAVGTNSSIEQNNANPLNGSSATKQREPKSVLVDKKRKVVDKVSASQDGTKNIAGKDNSSKEMDSKNVPKVSTDKENLSDKSHMKEGNTKEGTSGNSASKVLPNGVPTKENSVPLKPPMKESARGEECDSSNKCTDENNKLIACLRVPGNDSPELSLLIQNKGTGPLSVKISAPDYVHIENNSVQLPANENKKVKVSIGKDNRNTLIVLTARGSNCSIDFKDLILHNTRKKANDTSKPSSTHTIPSVPIVLSVAMVAMILSVLVLISVAYWRKRVTSDGSKYQKLETELPLSSVEKKETDTEDGWDDSWGDSWDDEEAPKTPSMPITPSLSSKGLASRKLSKDSWKD